MGIKLLIKRAFKSLFRNKFFTVLMMLLVFLSSATYTIFESTTSNFNSSYKTLFDSGNVHQAIVRENYRLSPSDKVVIDQLKISTGDYVPLNSANLQRHARQVGVGSSNYDIDVATSQDFASYGYRTRPSMGVRFTLRASNWDAALRDVNALASPLQSDVEERIRESQSESFISGLNKLYSTELTAAPFVSTNIHASDGSFKVVRQNLESPYTKVNKMYTYDGDGIYSAQKTDEELIDELRALASLKWPGVSFDKLLVSEIKKYRISATNSEDVTRTPVSAFEISAFQANVSPAYARYYSKVPIGLSNFEALATSDWREYYPDTIRESTTFLDAMNSKLFVDRFARNIIWVDAMPFFIVGVGATPDLAYPVIDESTPTIDVASQAVVYVNNRGYQRVRDAFRANQQENFISLAFSSGVSSARRAEILNEIEQISQTTGGATVRGVSFPENTYSTKATMVYDLSNANSQIITLAQVRMGFLQNLNNTIGVISVITTSLLAIFVSVIVIMVFNVLLRTDRKSLATLLALGYNRSSIAFATSFISFVLGAIPAFIGYLVGFVSRYILVDVFIDFWTLPTFGTSFSLVSILITFLLPTVLMFLLILVSTLFTLRHDIKTMVFDISLRNSWIIEMLIRPFKFISIRGKYVIALMFRNFGKLMLVALATITSSIALLVGFSTIGKSDQAYQETVAVTNYEYKFDLYSPTVEGGQFTRVDYKTGFIEPVGKEGFGYFNHDGTLVSYDETYRQGSSNVTRSVPHWHIVGTGDNAYSDPTAIGQYIANAASSAEQLLAVKNYLLYKLQFKSLIDRNILNTVNPWDIVKQLMPDNQQNLSTQSVVDLRNAYSQIILSDELDISNGADLFEQILINERSKFNASGIPTGDIYHPYLLSYNTVITNGDDEDYSYLDTEITLENQISNYRVVGFKDDSRMYNFGSSVIRALQSFNKPNTIPVVVNKFMRERFGLVPGTRIDAVVKNHLRRNIKDFITPHQTLEVVDIIDGYNNSGFFTLQSIVNPILGYDANGFNGILSAHKDSALASSIPLYSPSGFYLPTDSFAAGSIYEQFLSAGLGDARIWSYKDDIASTTSEFYNKYTRSLFTPMFTQVSWREMDQQTFRSISNLSSILINVIETVSIILSIIFTFIVTSLIIRSNRKRIATLWALGYRKKEVITIFSAQFLSSILVSLAVALPISIVILQEVLRSFVIDLGQILIPFELVIWAPFVVIIILAGVFVTSTSYSIGTLSSQHALQAFKTN